MAEDLSCLSSPFKHESTQFLTCLKFFAGYERNTDIKMFYKHVQSNFDGSSHGGLLLVSYQEA